jgi:hypothetical protein
MKKLTSIAFILLFSLVLINKVSADTSFTQRCQMEKISASYTGISQSKSCRDQEKVSSIVGSVFKWFIIIFVGFILVMAFIAISSPPPKRRHHLHTEHKPKPPKLTPKELQEKQARQNKNKKKRSAKQKAELDRMTKIINENKAKKNKKK